MTPSCKCSESLEEGWASLQGLVSNMSQYLACVEVDKFEAAESEEALSKRGLELLETNQLWGGLVFVGLGPGQQELPKFVTYKIRIDADKVSRPWRLGQGTPAQWANTGGQAQIKESTGIGQLKVFVFCVSQ